MPDVTPKQVSDQLLASNFTRADSGTAGLSDPIADTPMVVTLDQLVPYELNPRVMQNPRYDDIKESIRQRGLDAPPAITRRPGANQFTIRNGGNTRLSILKELWAATREEKFFRISCLFRPWTARGEIVALTGHLSENELRGELSFIERACGVEKARTLYEQEAGKPLTQTELARRLCADGYPITQSHISRLQDAVRYLLPAIPNVLYAGLGKPQIDRLSALRKSALRIWERRAQQQRLLTDFASVFQDVLETFDGAPEEFNPQRVQDALVGQFCELLHADYDELTLELVDGDSRLPASAASLDIRPSIGPAGSPSTSTDILGPDVSKVAAPNSLIPVRPLPESAPHVEQPAAPRSDSDEKPPSRSAESHREVESEDSRIQNHIVSPAETTDRLQSIQRTIAEATGDTVENFADNVVRSIPVQAGGLHPISDVWYIEPAIDAPDPLRAHIAQFATEIAQEADLEDRIEPISDGVGFVCTTFAPRPHDRPLSMFARGVLTLLSALSSAYVAQRRSSVDGVRLMDDLGPLLLGPPSSRRGANATAQLSDSGLVKLFRLIRLARRLMEIELGVASEPTGTSGR